MYLGTHSLHGSNQTEFERFDHVGSQTSSDPAFELLLTQRSNTGASSQQYDATGDAPLTFVSAAPIVGRSSTVRRGATLS